MIKIKQLLLIACIAATSSCAASKTELSSSCVPIHQAAPVKATFLAVSNNSHSGISTHVYKGNSMIPDRPEKTVIQIGHEIYFEVIPVCISNEKLTVEYVSLRNKFTQDVPLGELFILADKPGEDFVVAIEVNK